MGRFVKYNSHRSRKLQDLCDLWHNVRSQNIQRRVQQVGYIICSPISGVGTGSAGSI